MAGTVAPADGGETAGNPATAGASSQRHVGASSALDSLVHILSTHPAYSAQDLRITGEFVHNPPAMLDSTFAKPKSKRWRPRRKARP
jgi:hypothetical protein